MNIFFKLPIFSVITTFSMCCMVGLVGLDQVSEIFRFICMQGLPTALEQDSVRTILETEECEYYFNPDGSCFVEYKGPPRPGPVKGEVHIFVAENEYLMCSRKLPPRRCWRRLLWTARGVQTLHTS